jgi:ABC-2 type transport system ATP-binding protein
VTGSVGGGGNFWGWKNVEPYTEYFGDPLNLVIEDVSKQYRGGHLALSNFSLSLKPGVLGLLGPNGAGKTTLMSILATITKASEGRVLWNGVEVAKDPDALRSVLGYLPQDFGVYPNLNAVEFLEYLAAVKGLDKVTAGRRITELLELVNLTDARKRALGGYSGGMKQRVGIAQALLNDPQLLIVDEPTAGLDPEERVRFRNLLSDLSGERIVILSTHIVSDVEATATDIALIAKGTLVAHATPEALLLKVEGKVWEWVISSTELNTAKQRFLISSTNRRSDGIHVRVLGDEPPPGAQPVSPNLEDAYLYCLSRHRAEVEQGAERGARA